ncbi:hypothetical protein XENOCAPTIV_017215 [Xenoophorus captivus]|uniref:Integrase n=1 Tax=Xenoophorus captivus TaxID=1517983 RepID=A0ABV0R0V8_9TELE
MIEVKGIQQLLQAEKRAAEKVTEARKREYERRPAGRLPTRYKPAGRVWVRWTDDAQTGGSVALAEPGRTDQWHYSEDRRRTL